MMKKRKPDIVAMYALAVELERRGYRTNLMFYAVGGPDLLLYRPLTGALIGLQLHTVTAPMAVKGGWYAPTLPSPAGVIGQIDSPVQVFVYVPDGLSHRIEYTIVPTATVEAEIAASYAQWSVRAPSEAGPWESRFWDRKGRWRDNWGVIETATGGQMMATERVRMWPDGPPNAARAD